MLRPRGVTYSLEQMTHGWKIKTVDVGSDSTATLEEVLSFAQYLHLQWLEKPGYSDKLKSGDNLKPVHVKSKKEEE